MKSSVDHPNEFIHLDKSNWYHNEMPKKGYGDPIQESVRRILGRSVIRTFGLFKYETHPLVDKHIPTFSGLHEAKISEVIDIVEEEFAHHQQTLQGIIDNLNTRGQKGEAAWYENNMQILVSNFSRMSSAFLGRQILETSQTFRVNKNWNSHDGQLGAAMCQLGSILASFENAANKSLVSTHFAEVIPQGCVQTGTKHGNQDVTYVEYMCAAMERHMIIGSHESFLNHVKFKRDNCAKKVHQIFDENIAGDVKAPVPGPTWAHTMDFSCTYRGDRLDRDMVELADPPTYSVPDNDSGFIAEYQETHPRIKTVWGKMRSEQKKIVNAILLKVDIIAEHIANLDLKDIAAKLNRSFQAGFTEPFFLATEEPTLKCRRPILAPHKFVYCSETIEGKANPEEMREFNKMMYNHYHNVLLNGGDDFDDAIKKMCEEGMEKHKHH